jgi:hypothetical protein
MFGYTFGCLPGLTISLNSNSTCSVVFLDRKRLVTHDSGEIICNWKLRDIIHNNIIIAFDLTQLSSLYQRPQTQPLPYIV